MCAGLSVNYEGSYIHLCSKMYKIYMLVVDFIFLILTIYLILIVN